jgi:hypothetical protein
MRSYFPMITFLRRRRFGSFMNPFQYIGLLVLAVDVVFSSRRAVFLNMIPFVASFMRSDVVYAQRHPFFTLDHHHHVTSLPKIIRQSSPSHLLPVRVFAVE